MKMRKYVVEFIGTFFLVLTVCMVAPRAGGDVVPLAVGAVLIAMIYAGWHISGAHFNPAVSLGVYLRGRLAGGELPAYMLAQIVGGVLAALLSGYFLPRMGITVSAGMAMRAGPALLAEFLGSFAAGFVILNVGTAKTTIGNSFYGLAIGVTVAAGMYIFDGIARAVFNPAIAAGLAVTGAITMKDLWIPIAATLVGGAVAAFVFNYVSGPE